MLTIFSSCKACNNNNYKTYTEDWYCGCCGTLNHPKKEFMNINITLLAVTKSTGTSKTGKPYSILEVAYKQDGQVKGKKLFEFKAKEICKVLGQASPGSDFTIEQEKEGDYWEWKSISSSTATASSASAVTSSATTAPAATKTVAGGNWETKEERAYKQVLIVKQSSLSQAVSTLKLDKAAADPEAVVALAQKYTNWVLGQDQQAAAEVVKTDSLEDDIPF